MGFPGNLQSRHKASNAVPFMVQFLWYSTDTNRKGLHLMYEFRNVRGHVEVYNHRGEFLFSADSEREAREELEDN